MRSGPHRPQDGEAAHAANAANTASATRKQRRAAACCGAGTRPRPRRRTARPRRRACCAPARTRRRGTRTPRPPPSASAQRDRVAGPERRPLNAGGVYGRLHRRDYTVILVAERDTGEERPRVFGVWSSTRASGTSGGYAVPRRRRLRGGEDMRVKFLGAIAIALLLILMFAVVAAGCSAAVGHRRDHQGRTGRHDRR